MDEKLKDSKLTPIQLNQKETLTRVSKIPVLLSILALTTTLYLGYEGVYGPFGLKKLLANSMLAERQLTTARENYSQQQQQLNKLQRQLTELEQDQSSLDHELKSINSDQNVIVVNQLNNLISAANQSLILYHDNSVAIKLLGYARQILQLHSEPQFNDLKISLTSDTATLQANSSFDNTVIATKLEYAYQLADQLSLFTGAKQGAIDADNNYKAELLKLWNKFVANFKKTILGMSALKADSNNNVSDDEGLSSNLDLLQQHLQLDILNAKQAFISRNQLLWGQSLKDALIITSRFINNQNRAQEVQMLDELQAINLNSASVNLDLTIHSLIKLQQQTPSVIIESAF